EKHRAFSAMPRAALVFQRAAAERLSIPIHGEHFARHMVNSFTNCEWLASAFQGCIFRLNRNGVYKGADRSVKGAIVRIAAQQTLMASTLAQNAKGGKCGPAAVRSRCIPCASYVLYMMCPVHTG